MSYFCIAFERKRLSECGNSSVGRAQPCQGWGREFESRFPLFIIMLALLFTEKGFFRICTMLMSAAAHNNMVAEPRAFFFYMKVLFVEHRSIVR